MTIFDEAFLEAVRAEVARARSKFPSNKHLMAALTEEVGEAAMALLDNHHKGKPHADVRDELMQVACVALRLATEGDPDFAYDPRQITWTYSATAPGIERRNGIGVRVSDKHVQAYEVVDGDVSFGPMIDLPGREEP